MPILHKTPYPVVDPDPSMGKAIANFNLNDWAVVGAWSSAGYLTGW